jgi:hypothetical protein
MSLNPRLRRFARDVARLATAVAAVMFVGTVVDALPAGTPPAGAMVLNPATGDSGTSISMTFANTPQFCPGDAVANYRWTTFIVPRSTDIASMTFTPSGNPQGPPFSSALRTAVPLGQLVRAQNPGLGDGIVIPPLAIDFANVGFSTLTPGEYTMGIACTLAVNGVVENQKYWTVPVVITASEGAGPNNFTYAVDTAAGTTTTTVADTTTTTVPDGGTTTTTVAGGTTTTTVAGGTTTTTVAGGSTSATISPSTPTPGGAYTVTFPNCSVGETITFQQAQSTPASVTGTCQASSALTSVGPTGFRRPLQATTGTATGRFTAAPTAPGTYTITMTGTVSAPRTVTFTISSTTTGGTGTGTGTGTVTGGSPTGTSTSGTIPATGSSTTSLIVWGVLLLVFGRMAILLGRKPKVVAGI